jgi:hypothetical protein
VCLPAFFVLLDDEVLLDVSESEDEELSLPEFELVSLLLSLLDELVKEELVDESPSLPLPTSSFWLFGTSPVLTFLRLS